MGSLCATDSLITSVSLDVILFPVVQNMEGLVHQKAQLSSQIDQLSESLDQHRATLEECEREEANKQESLRMMGMELERKRGELAERLRDLEKVREKAVEEENRLSKVIYLNFK